jgi:hypothetical protein
MLFFSGLIVAQLPADNQAGFAIPKTVSLPANSLPSGDIAGT